ncbi:MAG: hypothetical protein ACHQYP_11710 [Nitrospiria bacterium]
MRLKYFIFAFVYSLISPIFADVTLTPFGQGTYVKFVDPNTSQISVITIDEYIEGTLLNECGPFITPATNYNPTNLTEGFVAHYPFCDRHVQVNYTLKSQYGKKAFQ